MKRSIKWQWDLASYKCLEREIYLPLWRRQLPVRQSQNLQCYGTSWHFQFSSNTKDSIMEATTNFKLKPVYLMTYLDELLSLHSLCDFAIFCKMNWYSAFSIQWPNYWVETPTYVYSCLSVFETNCYQNVLRSKVFSWFRTLIWHSVAAGKLSRGVGGGKREGNYVGTGSWIKIYETRVQALRHPPSLSLPYPPRELAHRLSILRQQNSLRILSSQGHLKLSERERRLVLTYIQAIVHILKMSVPGQTKNIS